MGNKNNQLLIYCVMVIVVAVAVVASIHLIEEGKDNRAHIKANQATRVASLCDKECQLERVEARQRLKQNAISARQRELLGRLP